MSSIHTSGARKVIRIEFNKLTTADKIELLQQLATDTPNKYNAQDSYIAISGTYLMNMVSNYEELTDEHTREEKIEYLEKYIHEWLKDQIPAL